MGHLLLWVESLAVILLFGAMVLAVISHWRPRILWGVGFLAMLVPLALVGYLTWGLWRMRSHHAIGVGLLGGTAAIALVSCLGYVGLTWRGLRRRAGALVRPAELWPRAKLAAGFALTAALWIMTLWSLDAAVRDQAMALRTEVAAYAMSLAPPRVPDNRNAALVYQQAFEAMAAQSEKLGLLHERFDVPQKTGRTLVDAKDDETRRLLDELQPIAAMLRRAAAMPDFCLERDWGAIDLFFDVSELQYAWQAARLLAADASVKAADGRPAEALADVAAIFRMAGHFKEVPVEVGLLRATPVEATARDALEDVLTRTKPTAEQLAELKLDPTTSYARAARREIRMEGLVALSMCMQLGGIKRTEWLGSIVDPPTALGGAVGPVFYRVFILRNDVMAVRAMTPLFDKLTSVPYYKSPRERWRMEGAPIQRRRRGVAQVLLKPDPIAAVWQAAAQADATHRVCQVAVGMASYRAKQGKYPDRLEQLVPAFLDFIPLDPLDGKPIRMARTDKGPVVYSIGEDLKDDGGRPYDQQSQSGDITFTLPK